MRIKALALSVFGELGVAAVTHRRIVRLLAIAQVNGLGFSGRVLERLEIGASGGERREKGG